MNQPNLLDLLIVLGIFSAIISACFRGLSREMLHTVLFMVAVTAGYLFWRDTVMPTTQQEVAKMAVIGAFFLAAVYAFMWGGMKIVAPLVIGGQHDIGLRSRFWAGALSMVKLAVAIIGLNLWFAVHSPDAHPLRLNSLPELARDSMFVQLSDAVTEDVYRYLASQNILDYQKFTERPATQSAQDKAFLEGLVSQ
ncbi:MAG: hypothetical protein EBQ80_05910 [Proteobacteria bacterium]|nr:hypothetical protein [Pseudomonadota bacterium]